MSTFYGSILTAVAVLGFTTFLLIARKPRAPGWSRSAVMQSSVIILVITLGLLGIAQLVTGWIEMLGTGRTVSTSAVLALAVLALTAVGVWAMHPVRRLRSYQSEAVPATPPPVTPFPQTGRQSGQANRRTRRAA